MSEVISVDKAKERLKAAEKWPFLDIDSGCEIHENLYYGFYDCGGVFKQEGSVSQEELVQEVKKDFDEPHTNLVGTNPEYLGCYAVAVLSGRQFIDRLYEISCYQLESFNDFGSWSR